MWQREKVIHVGREGGRDFKATTSKAGLSFVKTARTVMGWLEKDVQSGNGLERKRGSDSGAKRNGKTPDVVGGSLPPS